MVLLGGGGSGTVAKEVAGSRNFLMQSAPMFVGQGYNVATFGKPSDRVELDYPRPHHERPHGGYRTGAGLRAKSELVAGVAGRHQSRQSLGHCGGHPGA